METYGAVASTQLPDGYDKVAEPENDPVNHTIKITTEEEWKTIEEFPNYEMTINGKIRHKKNKITRKTPIGKRGYPVVSFKKNGKEFLRTVHILLGRTFIPNPLNLPEINHIDGNKLNNSIENLEWCTSKENTDHARRIGLRKSDGDKQVVCYFNGEKIAVYKSASEASRQTGIKRCNICSVARGNTIHKTAGGYEWRYE